MLLLRAGLILLLLFSAVATAQPGPSDVISARVESITAVPDKPAIHVNIRNLGQRPITAYEIRYYHRDANGERASCGGHGADMIDWSDPMPASGIYVHMRRNWIPPNGTISFDDFPRCAGLPVPLDGMEVELSLIMFDDGTGEGDARKIEFFLRNRQQMRRERLKWVERFVALRDAPDLRLAARTLYQDLVDAARSAEINPDDASREGMAKPVRDDLQRLALDITQWAAYHKKLSKGELLEWRITDLEQRTARLVQGAGTVELKPY